MILEIMLTLFTLLMQEDEPSCTKDSAHPKKGIHTYKSILMYICKSYTPGMRTVARPRRSEAE